MIIKSHRLIAKAIRSLDPNAEYGIKGNIITWFSSPIDEEAIQAKLEELQADYEAKQYQRDRAVEYPQIGDQLDMLYHAIDAGKVNKTSDFYKALKAVKDKHPKG